MSGIWLRPERSGRGPEPEHDRAAIAAAGIRLADAGGLAAASMRRVGAEIGASAAALYRYVRTREELLELMADAAVGELVAVPATGEWRADLLALAREVLGLYRRHPWLLEAGRGPLGPNGLGYLEQGLALLSPLDRPGAAKLEALGMLTGVVQLVARLELSAGDAAQWQADQAALVTRAVADGAHPHLAAAVGGGSAAPEGELLDRILPRVLAGLLGA
ncbi:TetR/AcrR family transcriptional regulator C-terminal domain-containing protein [Pseudonocardia ailaonensis]|uniref:TetR/AcrR family transcriptional regulator C-terminal domain-containing protein n=1 Tax=Pseudonocardia ailaonensis TaxID=367279 RepID=A0ABN2N747_9PSEU